MRKSSFRSVTVVALPGNSVRACCPAVSLPAVSLPTVSLMVANTGAKVIIHRSKLLFQSGKSNTPGVRPRNKSARHAFEERKEVMTKKAADHPTSDGRVCAGVRALPRRPACCQSGHKTGASHETQKIPANSVLLALGETISGSDSVAHRKPRVKET